MTEETNSQVSEGQSKAQNKDIYTSYHGRLEAGSIEESTDKRGQQYVTAKLVVPTGAETTKTVKIYGFGDQAQALRAAYQAASDTIIHGFLLAGGSQLRSTSFGPVEHEGKISYLKHGTNDLGQWASFLLERPKKSGEGTYSTPALLTGEDAQRAIAAGDGAVFKFSGRTIQAKRKGGYWGELRSADHGTNFGPKAGPDADAGNPQSVALEAAFATSSPEPSP